MISAIEIQNFESWKDTSFELHPGVNIFSGISDKGKSGLIRALKWNHQNRPIGDSFRNDFLKDKKEAVTVKVTYKEGNTVERKRNASGINHYKINDQEPMVALRSDIPTEVSDLSRMKKVNIQGQHPQEQYFLLSDKPGDVAKKFNKVSGLAIMDKALMDINSQVRNTNSQLKVYKEEIEIREEQLKNFEWISKAENHALKLKNITTVINKKRGELTYLKTLTIKVNLIAQELQNFKGIDSALKELTLLNAVRLEIVTIVDQRNTLLYTVSTLIELDARISEIHSITLASTALKKLQQLHETKEKTHCLFVECSKIVKALLYSEKELKISKMKLKNAVEEFKKVKDTTICPTCGRKGEKL